LLPKGLLLRHATDDGATALHLAVSNRHAKVTEALLRQGASANALDVLRRSALHCACEVLDDYLVELLLKQGAEVTLRDLRNETPVDKATRSSLSMARSKQQERILALLKVCLNQRLLTAD
jgi:ankyrin repeat protein